MSSEKYITVYMRDYLPNYRVNHPEYLIKDKERAKNRYDNDNDYKEYKKQKALERYYRIKQEKQQVIASN
jgi:hypothetical protein